MSPSGLQACADRLAPIFTQIFSTLELCEVPFNVKCATIILAPTKPSITRLNVYRLVDLNLWSCHEGFEQLVSAHLKNVTRHRLHPCSLPTGHTGQWMTVYNGLHYILRHPTAQGHVPRDMCMDPQHHYPRNHLIQTLPNHCMRHQLPDKQETAGEVDRIDFGSMDSPHWCSPGCPLLFSLCTQTTAPPTTQQLNSLSLQAALQSPDSSKDDNKPAYWWEVEWLVLWSGHKSMELNMLKTVAMTLDFMRHSSTPHPLPISNSTVSSVDSMESFKLLGVFIS